jgi:hypothetical protein
VKSISYAFFLVLVVHLLMTTAPEV